MDLKKIFNVYNTSALIVIPVVIIVIHISAPYIAQDIRNAKLRSAIESMIWLIKRNAKEFKHQYDRWPTSIQELDSTYIRKIETYQQFWDFSIEESQDTFVVTATLRKEYANLDELFIGEFLSEDNYGNKTYSHTDFKDKYFRAYLFDAKKASTQ